MRGEGGREGLDGPASEREPAVGSDYGALVTGQLGHKYADKLHGIWLSHRIGDVESVFPREHLITNATIWWVTNSITTSIRSYVNANRYPWKPSHARRPIIEAPAGMTFLGFQNPPGVTTAERAQQAQNDPKESGWYNPIHLKAHDHGATSPLGRIPRPSSQTFEPRSVLCARDQ